jgi:hypothetical protein
MCDSRYYDACNTTDPNYIAHLGPIPFSQFSKCAADPPNVNCSDSKYGFPVIPAQLLKTAVQANGTATYSDQGGSLTSPPYGSTTVWHFYGSTDDVTATGAQYKAGANGASATSTGGASPGKSSARTLDSGFAAVAAVLMMVALTWE